MGWVCQKFRFRFLMVVFLFFLRTSNSSRYHDLIVETNRCVLTQVAKSTKTLALGTLLLVGLTAASCRLFMPHWKMPERL